VCGDNHNHFVEEGKGRYVVNCGSLMRSNIDQVDHKSVVYVYDTETKTLSDPIFLKIQSVKEVFDLKSVNEEKERNKKLDLFVENLSQHHSAGINFLDNLKSVIPTLDVDVAEIIKEAMNE